MKKKKIKKAAIKLVSAFYIEQLSIGPQQWQAAKSSAILHLKLSGRTNMRLKKAIKKLKITDTKCRFH